MDNKTNHNPVTQDGLSKTKDASLSPSASTVEIQDDLTITEQGPDHSSSPSILKSHDEVNTDCDGPKSENIPLEFQASSKNKKDDDDDLTPSNSISNYGSIMGGNEKVSEPEELNPTEQDANNLLQAIFGSDDESDTEEFTGFETNIPDSIEPLQPLQTQDEPPKKSSKRSAPFNLLPRTK